MNNDATKKLTMLVFLAAVSTELKMAGL